MVRRQSEQTLAQRPSMYDGEGTVQLRHMLNGPEEMNGKGRLFSVLTILVGGSIGPHVHQGESETFYVLAGQGEYNDGGVKVACGPGDVLYTPVGGLHGMANTGTVPLEFVALILYE